MQVSQIVYISTLAAVSLYALLLGGWPERTAAIVNVAASSVSRLISMALPHAWQSPMFATWGVDLIVCLSFLWIMLTSDRFWTIWNFAVAVDASLSHLGRVLQPHLPRMAYQLSTARWAYIALGLLALGTYAHRRRKTKPS